MKGQVLNQQGGGRSPRFCLGQIHVMPEPGQGPHLGVGAGPCRTRLLRSDPYKREGVGVLPPPGARAALPSTLAAWGRPSAPRVPRCLARRPVPSERGRSAARGSADPPSAGGDSCPGPRFLPALPEPREAGPQRSSWASTVSSDECETVQPQTQTPATDTF